MYSVEAIQDRRPNWPLWAIITFILVTLAGVFWAKWDPYFGKAFHAAATHSLGTSIIAGTQAAPPPFSWQAALQYGIVYGKDIWEALLVGLLVGSGVQSLLPRDWLVRVLGKAGFKSSVISGAAAIPSMM